MNSVSRPIQSVLFACSLNAVRSPMAEAIARQLYGRKLYVDSAGLSKSPRDPFALAALNEIGITFEDDEPQMLDEIDCEAFDLIVALTPEALKRASELTRAASVEIAFWPVSDPTQESGSRDQRIAAYRAVREGLKARIRAEIGPRVSGGAGTTG